MSLAKTPEIQTKPVPVITIDGPSGSGKGTISITVAKKLNFHYLDSGALYRILGHLALLDGVDFSDGTTLVKIAKNMEVSFENGQVLLNSEPLGDVIRTEEAGKHASMISPIPEVRETLLVWQRHQAKIPGLVADGRDMGTVVFPDATCKIFLTASVQARAERRYKQLRDKGFDVNIRQLFQEISERDERDASRKVSPLKPAEDAILLDTTGVGIQDVVSQVVSRVKKSLQI